MEVAACTQLISWTNCGAALAALDGFRNWLILSAA